MRKLISRYDAALNIINFKLVKKYCFSEVIFVFDRLSFIALNKLILSVLIKT
jgi:hypothetical protein